MLAQGICGAVQVLQASQQAQAASLQERQVLLSDEQLALEADIEVRVLTYMVKVWKQPDFH